jgi:hypothetical protein
LQVSINDAGIAQFSAPTVGAAPEIDWVGCDQHPHSGRRQDHAAAFNSRITSLRNAPWLRFR